MRLKEKKKLFSSKGKQPPYSFLIPDPHYEVQFIS